MQQVALELGIGRNIVEPFVVAEPVERAEQIAEGVAELAIPLRQTVEDLLRVRDVGAKLDRRDP